MGNVARTGTMAKTIVVHIPFYRKHRIIPRTIKSVTKLFAHDEFELCRVGDRVRLEQSRRLSRRKSHVVAEIIRRDDGSDPPTPFPNVRGLVDHWPEERSMWDEKGKVAQDDKNE